MKLDKADKPKVIVLGALVAVIIGYVVFTTTGKKAAAPPPSAAERSAPKPESKPLQAAATPAPSQQAAATIQVAMLNAQTKSKDPFAPRLVPQNLSMPAVNPPRITRLATLPQWRPGGDMSFGVKPLNPGVAGTAATVPEADPQFTLTGVINGATSVAIIRGGDTERHIVKEGQLINGKYLVRSISRDRVVLTREGRYIELKLGGRSNAK